MPFLLAEILNFQGSTHQYGVGSFSYLIENEMRLSMKPLKNKVSITLDSDIIEQLKLLAEQDDRSFSQYINMILKEYLTQADKKKEA